jgi:hypothetical protein
MALEQGRGRFGCGGRHSHGAAHYKPQRQGIPCHFPSNLAPPVALTMCEERQ